MYNVQVTWLCRSSELGCFYFPWSIQPTNVLTNSNDNTYHHWSLSLSIINSHCLFDLIDRLSLNRCYQYYNVNSFYLKFAIKFICFYYFKVRIQNNIYFSKNPYIHCQILKVTKNEYDLLLTNHLYRTCNTTRNNICISNKKPK